MLKSIRCFSTAIQRCTTMISTRPMHRPLSGVTTDADPPSTDQEYVSCLESYGIPSENCREVLSQLPHEQLTAYDLNQTLHTWSSLQFGRENIATLVLSNPTVLLRERTEILHYFAFLSTLFNNNQIYKAFLNTPNIFVQKEKQVKAKVEFLTKTISIPIHVVLNSQSLCHSITHLKTRHEFMKRCGLFKEITVKNAKTINNPLPGDIFDTSDEVFAKKVAKLQLVEYETFQSLYSRELEDDDEDSDSD